MRSYAVSRWTGTAALTGAALAGASPAGATPAGGPRTVRVPCSAPALGAMITIANTLGPTVLRLSPNCVYDIITPASTVDGLPIVTGNVTLVGGPSTTIRRSPTAAAFRILNVATGGTLRVVGISILNGSTTGLGGGILVSGTLVLNHTTLSGNTAENGGAVAVNAGANATISRTVISFNPSTSVGGGGVITSGNLAVFLTRIIGNTAPINGGGINTQPGGIARVTQSTVDGNSSGSLGGGLSNLGTTVLIRTLVTRNRGAAGGGIATGNTNVSLQQSIVRNNIPDNCNPLNTIPGCVG
jgi:hypothetical protein